MPEPAPAVPPAPGTLPDPSPASAPTQPFEGLLQSTAHFAALESNVAGAASVRDAALELQGFSDGTLSPVRDREDHFDWTLDFWLRLSFFLFALLINLWWDYNVRQMIWQSGRVNAGFHLSDGVLIALLTTSIANFIGLLTIIANYLFRERPRIVQALQQSRQAAQSDS